MFRTRRCCYRPGRGAAFAGNGAGCRSTTRPPSWPARISSRSARTSSGACSPSPASANATRRQRHLDERGRARGRAGADLGHRSRSLPDGDGEPNPYVVSQPGSVIGAMALVVARPRDGHGQGDRASSRRCSCRASAFMKLCQQSPGPRGARRRPHPHATSRRIWRRDRKVGPKIGSGTGAPAKPARSLEMRTITGTWSEGLALQPRAGLTISAPLEWAGDVGGRPDVVEAPAAIRQPASRCAR